jgi:hypothetical protein
LSRDHSNLGWALAGATVTAVVMSLVIWGQLRESRQQQLSVSGKATELARQARLALVSASEAEKGAVLAVSDEASGNFAGQARSATATVAERLNTLNELLRAGGSKNEREALAQLTNAFHEFVSIDNELLDLAVKNTNVKAYGLAFGPCADALRAVDAALSRVVADSARSTATNSKKVMEHAAGAQAAALRIALLLPPHIAEGDDKKMDELEVRMAKDDQIVHAELHALVDVIADRAELEKATASYERYTELKTQILKLSRENTNVRSLALSLNQNRKAMALCLDALDGIDKAIEEENTGRTHLAPVRPR